MVYDDKRQRIVDALDICEVVHRYTGLEFRHNRCACPLHNGKNNNFTLYPKTKSFFCFACGCGGDVIKFVSEYFNLNYSDAMVKLYSDYNLGVYEKQHMTYNAIAKRVSARMIEQQKIEAFNDYQKFSYFLLIRYFKWLQKQPKNNAVQHDISFVERLLDKHLNYCDKPIQGNIKALIRALHTKHRKGG
jgi:DNA primase